MCLLLLLQLGPEFMYGTFLESQPDGVGFLFQLGLEKILSLGLDLQLRPQLSHLGGVCLLLLHQQGTEVSYRTLLGTQSVLQECYLRGSRARNSLSHGREAALV